MISQTQQVMKRMLTCLLLPGVLISFCGRLQAAHPGFALLGAYGKQLNQQTFLGLGSGVVVLQDVVFAPVFIDFTGNRGGRFAANLVNLQAGYAPGFDRCPSVFKPGSIRGGLFLGAGAGQQIRLGDQLSFALILAYRHQFAGITYEGPEGYYDSEKLNFGMLSLGIKIIL